VDNNPFFCPDAEGGERCGKYLDGIRKAGSSIGAVIEVTSPRGRARRLGCADLRQARQRTRLGHDEHQRGQGRGDRRRVRGRRLSGEDNADEIRMHNGKPEFLSNHAGGILGGISTGQDIVVRFAVKPTSSILTPRQTITKSGEEADI
jgi:chorismate synthase